MRKKCVDPTAVSFVEVIIFLIIFKEQAKQTLIVEDVFSFIYNDCFINTIKY